VLLGEHVGQQDYQNMAPVWDGTHVVVAALAEVGVPEDSTNNCAVVHSVVMAAAEHNHHLVACIAPADEAEHIHHGEARSAAEVEVEDNHEVAAEQDSHEAAAEQEHSHEVVAEEVVMAVEHNQEVVHIVAQTVAGALQGGSVAGEDGR
jgi:hypothetical protein